MPLDYLGQDPEGSPVLVYDYLKSYWTGWRQPIGKSTAGVITSQQQRVREMFADTPSAS